MVAGSFLYSFESNATPADYQEVGIVSQNEGLCIGSILGGPLVSSARSWSHGFPGCLDQLCCSLGMSSAPVVQCPFLGVIKYVFDYQSKS